MPVYKNEKNGTWEVSYSFKDLPTGKFKKRHKRGFKTKADAKKWERENYCGCSSKESKTFKELAIEWQNNMQLSKESKRHYESHLKYRFAELNDIPVEDITIREITEWKINLGNNPEWSTLTKNSAITFLKSVMKYGQVMYGFKDQTAYVKRFKPTNEEIMQEMNIWTPEEFGLFIEKVTNYELKVYFKFLFWTGCRRGEAIALQRKDVLDSKVRIRYSQRTQEEGLKPTKTKQTRIIDIDDELYSDLLTVMDGKSTSYVFGSSKGLAPTTIDRCFKEAVEEAKVMPIRIHDLRHSHASWLINNGVNIVSVSKRLGHSSIETTLKTYTHLIDESDIFLMNTINDYKYRKTVQEVILATGTKIEDLSGTNCQNPEDILSKLVAA